MIQSAPIPAERVTRELARVFQGQDFHPQEGLLESFWHWLRTKLGLSGWAGLGDLVQILVVVLACALIVFLVWRLATLRDERRARAQAPDGESEIDLARRIAELASAARAARAAGDLRLALRFLFTALVLALGGRGDLEVRAAWTNRELLRRGKASRAARELLDPLVRELEPKEFGRAAVALADVERLEHLLAAHAPPAATSSAEEAA